MADAYQSLAIGRAIKAGVVHQDQLLVLIREQRTTDHMLAPRAASLGGGQRGRDAEREREAVRSNLGQADVDLEYVRPALVHRPTIAVERVLGSKRIAAPAPQMSAVSSISAV